MPSFQRIIFKFCLLGILFYFSFSKPVEAEEIFLEPVVQSFPVDEVIPAIANNGRYYIELEALAMVLQMNLIYHKGGVEVRFLDKVVPINFMSLEPNSYILSAGKYYLATDVYQKLFGLRTDIKLLDMQLDIGYDKELPVIQKLQAQQRRQNMQPYPEYDSFNNYQFDNRYWSTPVVDLTLQNNHNIRDYNGRNERNWNSDYYQIDSGMLVGGFDAYASFFGDSENNNHNPRARITVGRTFLDEPKNALNLTSFEAGDVTGFNSTLFNNSANGRGLYASSFKDLVLSADKTIDISGPISAGWDVELYLNNQLIGFRQSGINGRYSFPNIPVNFGLNTFKLVFYGPYGEIETEEREYYSGTSPVKAGEFGYTLNAYQKDHYLFDKNEPWIGASNKPTIDFTGYYGIDDTLTFISGLTQTANPETDETMNLGTAGMQYIWGGASVQYNTLIDFDKQNTGHHIDVQGDVGIGTVFARYDYYGDMQAPVSYYDEKFMKDVAELRLSGFVPYSFVPYYISYIERNSIEGEKIQEVRTRLSPNFMQYYNLSIENIISRAPSGNNDYLLLLLQAQYGDLGLHTQLRYNVSPSSYLQSFSQQLDYRWDRNTYFQFNWDHDYRSSYSTLSDIDTFSVSAGRLFSFGGLSLTMSADTDKNAAISLTYNLSFGKVPDRPRMFADAQSHMSKRSAIYARVVDENNNPVEGTDLQVSGLQDPVTTDENGEALLNDLEPYQKTVLSIDPASIDDIALVPEYEHKKLVLRPGTVLPLTINFTHRGGLEGYLVGKPDLYEYKVLLKNAKGEVAASKTPEEDGSFIFDNLSFGKYQLIVQNSAGQEVYHQEIKLEDAFLSLAEPLKI